MNHWAAAAEEVVGFWEDAGPAKWFAKDAVFDEAFKKRFLQLHLAAACGELAPWLTAPRASLALLVLLDQFPRNSFRGTPRMYWTDPLARSVARKVIRLGFDRLVPDHGLRNFFYLPLVHSECLADQEQAVALTAHLHTDAGWHAREHRDIIARFGRFPHRNPILGRRTTREEQEFLDAGGFAG